MHCWVTIWSQKTVFFRFSETAETTIFSYLFQNKEAGIKFSFLRTYSLIAKMEKAFNNQDFHSHSLSDLLEFVLGVKGFKRNMRGLWALIHMESMHSRYAKVLELWGRDSHLILLQHKAKIYINTSLPVYL